MHNAHRDLANATLARSDNKLIKVTLQTKIVFKVLQMKVLPGRLLKRVFYVYFWNISGWTLFYVCCVSFGIVAGVPVSTKQLQNVN